MLGRKEVRVLLLHACSFVMGWVGCYLLLSRSRQPERDNSRHRVAGGTQDTEEEERCGTEDPILIHARKNPDDEIKMVFAVRNDLKMTKGKMCAQVAHAAVEAVQQAEEEVPDLVELWEESGCTKVCLKVNSEDLSLRSSRTRGERRWRRAAGLSVASDLARRL